MSSCAARRNAREVQVPTFSLSPSDAIQRVAEGLLSLPRLFEVYQDDDALAFSLHTLPFVDNTLLNNLSEHADGAAQQIAHARRQSTVVTAPGAGRQLQSPVVATFSTEAIESVWLSSLGRALLAHLTGSVLPKIKSLSPAGSRQLASDLSYLSTIVGALNAESEDFSRWREYVSMSDEEGREALVDGSTSNSTFTVVAWARGWTTVPPTYHDSRSWPPSELR